MYRFLPLILLAALAVPVWADAHKDKADAARKEALKEMSAEERAAYKAGKQARHEEMKAAKLAEKERHMAEKREKKAAMQAEMKDEKARHRQEKAASMATEEGKQKAETAHSGKAKGAAADKGHATAQATQKPKKPWWKFWASDDE